MEEVDLGKAAGSDVDGDFTVDVDLTDSNEVASIGMDDGSVSNGQDGSKSSEDGSILTVGTEEMEELNLGGPEASTGAPVLPGVTTRAIVN